MNTFIQENIDGLIDVGILAHGFAPYMRDYDVILEWASFSSAPGTYRYRFTHCVRAEVNTMVKDEFWREAWTDDYTDYKAWEQAGAPEGFVWGTNWSNAYPGGEYLPDSLIAKQWSERLGKPMHEMRLETEAFRLQLVFHDLVIEKLSDHATNQGKIPLKPW